MKGSVPSFHGSELCIAVIYIYIYIYIYTHTHIYIHIFHIMAQHLSRDFKISEVFEMFLSIPRWNTVQYV